MSRVQMVLAFIFISLVQTVHELHVPVITTRIICYMHAVTICFKNSMKSARKVHENCMKSACNVHENCMKSACNVHEINPEK